MCFGHTTKRAQLKIAALLVPVAFVGCGTSRRDVAEEASEARLRHCAERVRAKPLELEATFEGEGRTSVSWVAPIYRPAPKEYPGPDGSGVRGYHYRYRLTRSGRSVSGWTSKPGFLLMRTREGQRLGLFVEPVDRRGARRASAHALLTISKSRLTPENVGESEPCEYGKLEMYPEPH
jgi:hypothetical protein